MIDSWITECQAGTARRAAIGLSGLLRCSERSNSPVSLISGVDLHGMTGDGIDDFRPYPCWHVMPHSIDDQ